MNASGNSVSAFSMYKNKITHKNIKKRHTKKIKGRISSDSYKEQNLINSTKMKNKAHTVLKPDLNFGVSKTLHNNSAEPKKEKAKIVMNKSPKLEIKEVDFFDKPHLTFEWLIAPITPTEFFKTFWENLSIYIRRRCNNYYQDLLTTELLDHILRTNSLFYTQNIDVVSYQNGKRETLNQGGRAYPGVLWDFYNNKCSIRILNPHTYCKKLHSLIATLQEFFGCMVGVNAYLTPPGSQGFAPHYDDIEAFVLQLEGRKHWKLYSPLTSAEILPRYSSKNFERHELSEPFKEVTLEAGDLLYFPRGIIHEGSTDADSHSLHVTISVYQKTAYIDLLEHALQSALTTAVRLDPQYRKGLPLQYLKHTGIVNSQSTSSTRDEIVNNVKELITRLADYVSVDLAADQLGKQFMWDAMPPVLAKTEKSCTIYENSEKIKNGVVYNDVSFTVETKVRLLSYHCLRVVAEEDPEETLRIYYCTENAKYYHGSDQQHLDIDNVLLPAVEFLIHNYPKYVKVGEIPLDKDTRKMQLASDLWERGLIVTEKPL